MAKKTKSNDLSTWMYWVYLIGWFMVLGFARIGILCISNHAWSDQPEEEQPIIEEQIDHTYRIGMEATWTDNIINSYTVVYYNWTEKIVDQKPHMSDRIDNRFANYTSVTMTWEIVHVDSKYAVIQLEDWSRVVKEHRYYTSTPRTNEEFLIEYKCNNVLEWCR